MRHVIHGSTAEVADARTLVASLTGARTALSPAVSDFFVAGRDVFVARAPLRAVLLGGVGAPGGCLSLMAPLGAGVLVALQRTPARTLATREVTGEHEPTCREIEVPLHFLEAGDRPVRPDVAHRWFLRHEHRDWFAPVAGTLLAVMRELGIRFGEGLRVLTWSPVPTGLGLGVRSALGVALVRAIFAEANRVAPARDLLRVVRQSSLRTAARDAAPATQWAVAALGDRGALLTQPAQPQPATASLSIPSGLALTVVTLGQGDDSPDLERGIWEAGAAGLRMVERAAAATAPAPRRRGPIVPELEEQDFAAGLGAELPDAPPEATDASPAPSRWSIRDATCQLVAEQSRCRALVVLWPSLDDAQKASALAALLNDAHAWRRAHAACTPGGQALVTAAQRLATQAGVVGARVMPGARAVVVVSSNDPDAGSTLPAALRAASADAGALVLSGTSPGASAFGYFRLRGA